MDFEKIFTIKEFAELRGVSQQAIYKQLSGKLSPFVVVRDGQKYISGDFFRQASAQPEHSTNSTEDSTKFNNHSTEVEQPVERDENTENYREMLDILREQLREKDNQISTLFNQVQQLTNQLKTKDEMASRLTTLLENSQKIEAGRLLVEATSKEENNEPKGVNEAIDTKKKKGIFSRIFHK